MNIFVTSVDPVACAKHLDDKRVVKMVLESAQLLSNALHLHGVSEAPYKLTHKGHPCTKWAAEKRSHYMWLFDHFVALCDEYTYRYKKIHKCEQFFDVFMSHEKSIPDGGRLTSFQNSSGFVGGHVCECYKLCMIKKWTQTDKRPAKWTNRQIPYWALNHKEDLVCASV